MNDFLNLWTTAWTSKQYGKLMRVLLAATGLVTGWIYAGALNQLGLQ